MKSKESQDALEWKQKVFMEPNGVFEWERTIDVECYCGHKQNSHLDGIEICLNGLCICEKFGVDKKVEAEVISPKAKQRFKRNCLFPTTPSPCELSYSKLFELY